MLELCKRVGLAREVIVGFEPLLRIDKMIHHLLDGARTAGQALVAREINHSHAPAAQQAFDPVTLLQNNSRLEGPGQRARWLRSV